MQLDLFNVRLGDSLYEDLLGQIRNDPALLARMWDDAESHLDEAPGKVWSVAAVTDHRGRWTPAAWAAAIEQTEDGRPVLKCCNNYERPGYRGHGAYAAAYAHRHTTIVAPSHLPGVTYLFRQPIGLHEADGWYRTGVQGVSTEAAQSHEWWELRRHPTG